VFNYLPPRKTTKRCARLYLKNNNLKMKDKNTNLKMKDKNFICNKICSIFEKLFLIKMAKILVNTKTENNLGKLRGILYKLQVDLEEFKNEVDSSYALLEIGEKSELSKKLEKSLENPIKDMFKFSSKIDNQVTYILDKVVRVCFKNNKLILEKVFKTRDGINDLHYSIVLKEDNSKNRDIFFSFLNQLDLTDISQKDKIYFQFIPSQLVNKIKFSEEINIS